MSDFKLSAFFKRNFLFAEEDFPFVENRNARYLYILLPVFFVFGLVQLVPYVVKAANHETGILKYLVYYGSMAFVSLGCFLMNLVTHRNRNISYYVKLIPVYISTLVFLGLSLFSIYFSEFFYNGFMVFCIESVIIVMIFELSPIIWALMVVTAMIGIGSVVLKTDQSYIFLNMIIFAELVIILCFWKRYHTVLDLRQKRELAKANKKSEDLLLNILPKKVMEDLRDNGESDPEEYKDVSILFTDIVNFTEFSKDLSPEVLIHELNDIFSHFDKIVEKYNCTRIKTIGDAYLAVCGLPEQNPNHAEQLMLCAQEFVAFLEERNKKSEHQWKMRIGIHSGNVVAGIVGIRKYIYDIFGDAVNTASRMESLSESMKINVSQEVYEELKDQFHFQKRELMEVKGKGKMQMYFVE